MTDTDPTISERPLLHRLEMTTENVTKTLRSWSVHFAEYFYPEVGTCFYRVPAFYFNHQNLLTPEQAAKRDLLSPDAIEKSPSSSTPSSASLYELAKCCESDAEGVKNTTVNDEIGCCTISTKITKRTFTAKSAESSELPFCGKVCVTPGGTRTKEDGGLFRVISQKDEYEGRVRPSPPPAATSNCVSVVTLLGKASSDARRKQPTIINNECKGTATDVETLVRNQNGTEKASTQDRDKDGEQKQPSDSKPAPAKHKSKRRRKGKPKSDNGAVHKQRTEEQNHATCQLHKEQGPVTSVFKNVITCSDSEEDGPSEKKERVAGSSLQENSYIDSSSLVQSSSSSSSEQKSDNSTVLNPEGFKKPKSQSTQTVSKNKAVQQPVLLISPPQESMARRDKAMTVVLASLEALGKELEAEGHGGLFVISGINYDHYLSRIPVQVLRQCEGGHLGSSLANRGILDILLLHQRVGILLVQVKSVGGNVAEWKASEGDIVAALKNVLNKVRAKSSNLRRQFCRELDPDSSQGDTERQAARVVHVLALPFVSRQIYNKTHTGESDEQPELRVLCKEDFHDPAGPERTGISDKMHTMTENRCSQPASDFVTPDVSSPCTLSSMRSPLWSWWNTTFHSAHTQLSQLKIKEIVGRICGTFSALTAQPDTKCRSEVRTLAHCVSEAASRYSAPCLTLQQYDLLRSTHRHVALAGPSGSGKSLLLTLKAVRWLEMEGSGSRNHVVVVSTGTSTAIPSPVRLLQRAILKRWTTWPKNESRLLQAVYPLAEIRTEDIEKEVNASVTSVFRRIHGSNMMDGDTDVVLNETEAEIREDEKKKVEKEKEGEEGEVAGDQIHFILSDLDTEDEKTLRILQALRQHRHVRSVWWSTTEPPRSQGVWSLYRTERQRDIIRRPPTVQRVMKTLDWRREWRSTYVTDSAEMGLPTEGPPVLYIQHGHQRRGRPRVCGSCQLYLRHRPESETNYFGDRPQLSKINGTDAPSWTTISYVRDCHCEGPLLCHTGMPNLRQESQECTSLRKMNINMNKEYVYGYSENADFLEDHNTHLDDNANVKVVKRKSEKSELGVTPDVLLAEESVSSQYHSPFSCPNCAEIVADKLSELMVDSINPRVSDFYVGSEQIFKDPSRNKFGAPIKPRDIIFLTAITPQEDQTDSSGHGDVRSILKSLVHSTFVLHVRNMIPLKILTGDDSSGKIACPKNSAILTDVSFARGLERKVTIYVPWKRLVGPNKIRKQNTNSVTDSNLILPLQEISETDARPSCPAINKTVETEYLCSNSAETLSKQSTAQEMQDKDGIEGVPHDSRSLLHVDKYILCTSDCKAKATAVDSLPSDEHTNERNTEPESCVMAMENEDDTPHSIVASSEEDLLSNYQPLNTPYESSDSLSEEQSTSSNDASASDFDDVGDLCTCDLCISSFSAFPRVPEHGATQATKVKQDQNEQGVHASALENDENTEIHLTTFEKPDNEKDQRVIFSDDTGINRHAKPLAFNSPIMQDQKLGQEQQEQQHNGKLHHLYHHHHHHQQQQQRQNQLQQDEMSKRGEEAAVTDGAERLPRWMDDKRKLRSKNVRKTRTRTDLKDDLLERVERLTDCLETDPEIRQRADGGPRSLDADDHLRQLSDLNRRGLYAAAACCVSQLIVILP